MKGLLLLAALLLLTGAARAQDAALEKIIQDSGAGAKTDWKTGFNGQIPLEAIVKAVQESKSGVGAEIGGSDADYETASQLISSLSNCTNSSCEIKGNDKFLGRGLKLDAAINMVQPGDDKGLKIDLKLIDAVSGKVLKSMSEPFDPSSKDSLNAASMTAAKNLLAGKDEETAAARQGAAADEEEDDALYKKLFAAGMRAYKGQQYSKAARNFQGALDLAETPQAKKMLAESRRKMKAEKKTK